MKRKITVLMLCVMLVLPLLTGCFAGGTYSLAHFRFTVSTAWELNEAHYNKQTRTNDKLLFKVNAKESVTVREIDDPLPMDAEYFIGSAVSGDTHKNVETHPMRSSYDAWSGSYEKTDFNGLNMRWYATVVTANGYLLEITTDYCSVPPEDYERDIQTLLDSLECTAEPPVYTEGEGAVAALHMKWSADWRPVTPEDFTVLLAFCPSHPATAEEAMIRMDVREIGNDNPDYDMNTCINTAVRRDGMDTQTVRYEVQMLEDKHFCGMEFDTIIRTRRIGKDDNGNENGNNTILYECYKTLRQRDYLVQFYYPESVQDTAEALLKDFAFSS